MKIASKTSRAPDENSAITPSIKPKYTKMVFFSITGNALLLSPVSADIPFLFNSTFMGKLSDIVMSRLEEQGEEVHYNTHSEKTEREYIEDTHADLSLIELMTADCAEEEQ